MSDPDARSHQESITVQVAADSLYDLVSDVTRTGEWSPVCTACWWDDVAEAGTVGAWFTGRNEVPDRTWETRSQVVAADRGREFAWVVGGNLVRWSFTLAAAGTGTILTESWDFLPDGIARFHERYGDQADAQILDRTEQALAGIPKTLAAIKRIAEATPTGAAGRRDPSLHRGRGRTTSGAGGRKDQRSLRVDPGMTSSFAEHPRQSILDLAPIAPDQTAASSFDNSVALARPPSGTATSGSGAPSTTTWPPSPPARPAC